MFKCRDAPQAWQHRLEKLLIYSLVNFTDDVRAAAWRGCQQKQSTFERQSIAQLAEDEEEEVGDGCTRAGRSLSRSAHAEDAARSNWKRSDGL